MTERASFVYFIQAGDIGPIKIGTSTNVQSRLAKMQTDTPAPLKLLGCIYGGTTEERALHKDLAIFRSTGEWFRPNAAVLKRIAHELANGGTKDFIKPSQPFVAKSPLQAWRVQNNLSLDEFAERAGTNATSICRMENNLIYGTLALHEGVFRATNGEITPNDLAPFMRAPPLQTQVA